MSELVYLLLTCFDLVVFVVDCTVLTWLYLLLTVLCGAVRQMLVIWWLVFGSGVEEFQICD